MSTSEKINFYLAWGQVGPYKANILIASLKRDGYSDSQIVAICQQIEAQA